MIERGVVAGFLTICTIQDVRKRQISMVWVGIFLGLGSCLWIGRRTLTMWEILGGLGVGATLLLVAKVTKEAVGYGDGWVLCTTGIYLGGWENFFLFWWGSVFAAGYAAILAVFGKKTGKTEIPFLPFLLAAHIIKVVCIWW